MRGDSLFVQFYSETGKKTLNLFNGFSDTYDLCREHGDFLWVLDDKDFSHIPDEDEDNKALPPIDRGTVYISALSLNHLCRAFSWAKRMPGVDFVVGGPVVAERESDGQGWAPLYVELKEGARLPSNFTATGASLEEWFGRPEFTGRWRLEPPEGTAPTTTLHFNYTLDNYCFWGRCIYCNIALNDPARKRERGAPQFEFADMEHPGRKIVRLNTGSLTPKHIRSLIPSLPARKDLAYRAFMRSARQENDALEEAIRRCDGKLPEMTLGLGIEFPSDRMWEHVGKGFDEKEVLRTMEVCERHGIRTNGNFILGWDNLVADDISKLEGFLKKIPRGSLGNAQVRWLYAHPHTDIHEAYEGEEIFYGPFYVGKRVRIKGTALELNKQAARIIKEYSEIKEFTIEGDVDQLLAGELD